MLERGEAQKLASSSQQDELGVVKEEETLRNAANFPTARPGPVPARPVLCWLGLSYWLIKNDFLKKLPNGR